MPPLSGGLMAPTISPTGRTGEASRPFSIASSRSSGASPESLRAVTGQGSVANPDAVKADAESAKMWSGWRARSARRSRAPRVPGTTRTRHRCSRTVHPHKVIMAPGRASSVGTTEGHVPRVRVTAGPSIRTSLQPSATCRLQVPAVGAHLLLARGLNVQRPAWESGQWGHVGSARTS